MADSNFSAKVEKLNIDFKKNRWYHRYNARFAFNDLSTFFRQETMPTIQLWTEDGIINLSMTFNKWKKDSAIVDRILFLIEQNK